MSDAGTAAETLIEFVPLDWVMPWPSNPRTIDRERFENLKASIQADPNFMLERPLLVQRSTRYTYGGNMRWRAVKALYEQGWRPDSWPAGTVPVIRSDVDDATAAERALRDNNQWGEYNEQQLGELVGRLHQQGRPTATLGFDAPRLQDILALVGLGSNEPPQGTPDAGSRLLPLDLIYTQTGSDQTCCVAVAAGLRYGTQSTNQNVCPWVAVGHKHAVCYVEHPAARAHAEAHQIAFVDNDYGAYHHAQHLAFVQQHHPKYATVRDIMTEQQCRDAGIAYFPLDQILAWASELEQAAANVIVIPKWDCLDQIPEQYVLGYSIPTSHGGTPLSVDAFKGRKVHLLGGSWKAQLAYLDALGDNVVSLDNNYVLKQAMWGQFVDADGEAHTLDELGFGRLHNPWCSALGLSAGYIARRIYDLLGAPNDRAETDL